MRLLLKILGGALLLGVLLLLVFLIPAHLQIRSVEPGVPTRPELRELLGASDGPVRLRYVNTSSQRLSTGELGHTVFVVEWANGDLFMIDAGMDVPTAIKFGRLVETTLGAGEATSHGTISDLLGEAVARVEGVAFTHLHIDHTQGIVPFCAARGKGATLFQTTWQTDLQNFNTTEAEEIIESSCLSRNGIGSEGLISVDGFPGLGVAALGGHSPGSTLFAIAVGGHLWILSGDIANSKADLISDTGKGFLYSYVMVPENTGRTEMLRGWLTGLDAESDMTVLVAHDLTDIRESGLAEYQR